jgi:hypothetical protein
MNENATRNHSLLYGGVDLALITANVIRDLANGDYKNDTVQHILMSGGRAMLTSVVKTGKLICQQIRSKLKCVRKMCVGCVCV